MNDLLLIATPFIHNFFFTKKELKFINSKLAPLKTTKAKVFFSLKSSVIREDLRSGQIALFNDADIKKLIYAEIIHQAEAAWDFKNSHKSLEVFQYAVYTEGNFFNWHTDSPFYTRFNKKLKTDRVITAILMLNDYDRYEGGNLEIVDSLQQIHKIKNLKAGEIVIFPSHYPHRITTIKKGVRKTLTLWIRAKVA